ncbi:hypothetical protein ILP86_04710 [Microbacterium sp. R1]|nr:hypothetical protein [Microbacterium sp. R1]MBE7953620.1 hypothetical protein [Microbacterium sp. R1]
MAAPKKPQDHKPKSPKAEKIKISIGEGDDAREVEGFRITVNEITVEVEKDALNDWEFLEDVADLQNGDGAKSVSMSRRLFGDQYNTVKENFRDEKTGRVSSADFQEFVQAVLEAVPNS